MQPELLRATPARLTATAAAKLPRLFLLTVGLVYILAGLFYRDPWKTDDVTGLATMLTALSDQAHALWLPHVGALAQTHGGPLATWVGALSIWLFQPLFEPWWGALDAAIIASRLPNLLWFGILTSALWYGTYLFGRRPEAQPLALPFGGEPSARDYGRMLADAALLLIVATVGIVWRMHETSSVPALIACQALAYYACARMLDRPRSGAITLGVALAGTFFAHGWTGCLPVLLAIAWLAARRGALGLATRRALAAGVALALVLVLAWWLPARAMDPSWTAQWVQWNAAAFSLPGGRALRDILRDLPWFLWPTWPLALLALWRWRRWLAAPHVGVPTAFALGALVALLVSAHPFEPEYSLLAVPCAVLAAFALPTLRRGVVNTLDWFAMMCFSLTACTVWLGWIALQMGWPAQIAANIGRQTRGISVHVAWPATAIAVAGTVAWVVLVAWRLRSRPAGLWRGTALSAGGLLTTWLLLATLWMPALDYVRSYRPVSNSLAHALNTQRAPGECVQGQDLGDGQRAAFYAFDRLQFRNDPHCALVLQQLDPQALARGRMTLADAPTLWLGHRAADRHEVFRLVRRHATQ